MKLAALLLVFAQSAFAACRADEILARLRPGAHWTLRGNTLDWLDNTTPPTKSEILAAQASCDQAQTQAVSDLAAAKQILKDSTRTPQERLDAAIKVLGLDAQ